MSKALDANEAPDVAETLSATQVKGSKEGSMTETVGDT